MKRALLLLLHWGIILNLLGAFLYAGYVLFFVLVPESGGGALFSRAGEVSESGARSAARVLPRGGGGRAHAPSNRKRRRILSQKSQNWVSKTREKA